MLGFSWTPDISIKGDNWAGGWVIWPTFGPRGGGSVIRSLVFLHTRQKLPFYQEKGGLVYFTRALLVYFSWVRAGGPITDRSFSFDQKLCFFDPILGWGGWVGLKQEFVFGRGCSPKFFLIFSSTWPSFHWQFWDPEWPTLWGACSTYFWGSRRFGFPPLFFILCFAPKGLVLLFGEKGGITPHPPSFIMTLGMAPNDLGEGGIIFGWCFCLDLVHTPPLFLCGRCQWCHNIVTCCSGRG